MRRLALGIFLNALVAMSAAHAADMVTKAVPKRLVNVAVPCTVLLCQNKFYVGAGIAGIGGNADIIGSGIAGSVFAGGAIPYGDAGWLTWNGAFLLGLEVGAGYQFNTGTSVNNISSNPTGFMAYQEFKVGGSLSSLFGSAAPVTPPTGLTADVMAPYVSFGAEEHSYATGWRSGAGIIFALPNSNILLDLGYRYTNFGTAQTGGLTFNSVNLVYAKFDVPLN